MHIEKEEKHFFHQCMQYFSKQELESMLNEFPEFERKMIHVKYQKIVEKMEHAK